MKAVFLIALLALAAYFAHADQDLKAEFRPHAETITAWKRRRERIMQKIHDEDELRMKDLLGDISRRHIATPRLHDADEGSYFMEYASIQPVHAFYDEDLEDIIEEPIFFDDSAEDFHAEEPSPAEPSSEEPTSVEPKKSKKGFKLGKYGKKGKKGKRVAKKGKRDGKKGKRDGKDKFLSKLLKKLSNKRGVSEKKPKSILKLLKDLKEEEDEQTIYYPTSPAYKRPILRPRSNIATKW